MNNVKTFRMRQKGLSQAALAHEVGCSQGNISLFERQAYDPKDLVLEKLCKYFGVSKEELIAKTADDLTDGTDQRDGTLTVKVKDTSSHPTREYVGPNQSREKVESMMVTKNTDQKKKLSAIATERIRLEKLQQVYEAEAVSSQIKLRPFIERYISWAAEMRILFPYSKGNERIQGSAHFLIRWMEENNRNDLLGAHVTILCMEKDILVITAYVEPED